MPDYKGGEIKNTAESTSKYKIKKIKKISRLRKLIPTAGQEGKYTNFFSLELYNVHIISTNRHWKLKRLFACNFLKSVLLTLIC